MLHRIGDMEKAGSANLRSANLQTCKFADLSAQEVLEYLERHNLFLVPLDDEGRWYRYHQRVRDAAMDHLGKAAGW